VIPPPTQGFQELIPPIDPPAIIPLFDEAPAVDVADFSGVGVAGGTATGVEEGGTPQNTAADSTFTYAVDVLEAAPRLTNQRQVATIMGRLYPRMLLNGRIEGTVLMQFVIEADGSVDRESLKVISATHEQFVSATTEALERFQFQPGRYRGRNVRVLIELPIQWRIQP
jgi:TonB family protein